VPKGGGASATLTITPNQPMALTMDSSALYWGYLPGSCGPVQPGIEGCPLTGCPLPNSIATSPGEPLGIAIGAGVLYWSCAGAPATIRTVGISGGAVGTLASATSPRALATDGLNAYWADEGTAPSHADGAVRTCPLAGCAAGPRTIVGALGAASLLALDASNVYVVTSTATEDAIVSCPLSGCSSPTTLAATALGQTHGLAVDSTRVYFTNGGIAYAAPLLGGAPTPLAPPDLATYITADATAVYWASTDANESTASNGIVKLAK
jgi:hypothetical protein